MVVYIAAGVSATLLGAWLTGAFRRERFVVTIEQENDGLERGHLITLREPETEVQADFVVVRRSGRELTLKRPSPWRAFKIDMARDARAQALRRAVRG
jgi:hypothetical protein